MGDRVYERFVECPEVIEIRWVSDDPDHHRPSEDMYNCQANGIPEDYGKKDKRTTEQAHFYCCVCECQSASLKTLRAHCEGTQHKRKAEQFFQQYQYRQRKRNSFNESTNGDTTRVNGGRHVYLSELCRRTPVVGLQYVEAYKSNDRHDPTLYMCILKNCKENNCEFKGEAEVMFEHLQSEPHGWSYFQRIFGNDFVQEDYDYKELLKNTILSEEKEYYKEYSVKPNSRDYQNVQNGNRPDSSYIRETVELEKEKRQTPRVLPPRSKRLSHNGSENNIGHEIHTGKGHNEDTVRVSTAFKIESVTGDNSLSKNTLKRARSPSDSGQAQGNHKAFRTTYSAENPLWTLPPSLQIEPKPDLSLTDEPQLTSGFPPNQQQVPAMNGCHYSDSAVPSAQVQIQDPVKKFNHDMANWVMNCMNHYYQYARNRETCIRKISDQTEYESLAKEFSRSYRKLEKESYVSTHGTYDGLEMNLDMKDRVKMQIDMHFETKPLLPLD